MALDIQSAGLMTDYIAYERPPQPMTLWTAIPRGLLTLYLRNWPLDAKALNDEMLLEMTGVLPPNFGYVMSDANLYLQQDEAIDWINVVNLNLQNYFRFNRLVDAVALSSSWAQEFPINDVIDGGRAISVVNPWPSFPMIGATGTTGIQINFSTGNAGAAATTAGVFNVFLSFWQFDLEQIRKYPINSPIPVQSR